LRAVNLWAPFCNANTICEIGEIATRRVAGSYCVLEEPEGGALECGVAIGMLQKEPRAV
jgi:hypothetical protein